ncbi:MAG: UDP-N-acetylmuramate--L-alanine ligase [Candidatus Methylacidiphilales bacterium]
MNHSSVLDLVEGNGRRILLGGSCGSGMIGLARMCLQKRYKVSGCDRVKTQEIAELEASGLVYHDESQLPDPASIGLVICSSALKADHPLRNWAADNTIPVLGRAALLAELLKNKEVILVVGTHGKTTSSVLMAHALRALGQDISFYIGAEVPLFGTSAHCGEAALAVVEADESDGSFQCFNPAHILVLNVEEDHLDYYRDLTEIKAAFRSIISKTQGVIVSCGDDEGARSVSTDCKNVITYGFTSKSEVQGVQWQSCEWGSRFLLRHGSEEVEVNPALEGKHNALNVLGVCAVLNALGYSYSKVAPMFEDVRGARRRFEIRARNQWGMVVDDYAHHPTEIRETLAAARLRAKKRLVAVFQPHRYSRTSKLMEPLAQCFKAADVMLLTGVYSAGEQLPEKDTGEELYRRAALAHHSVCYYPDQADLLRALRTGWQKDDLVLFMGAGDITKIAAQIALEVSLADEVSRLLEDEGEVLLYEPMSRHTTLRVGGPVDMWVEVRSEAALRRLIYFSNLHHIPWMVVGRGSNLLVKDGGLRGMAIHLSGEDFKRITITDQVVHAGAGVRLKDLVSAAKDKNLGGFEFMEGIPGELGGALRMNAGAMQSWMIERVVSIKTLDKFGNIKDYSAEKLSAEYRVIRELVDCVVISAVLKGIPDKRESINNKLKQNSEKRWKSQPPKPSAGCSFKNTPDLPTGKLIEEMGLKGKKWGGAEISSVHGNFIVNDGTATAEDVLSLMKTIEQEAKDKRGLILEREVIVVGE